MSKLISEDYFNCTVYENFSDENKKFYTIRHTISNQILHSSFLSEAYRIAKLLDLEFRVSDWGFKKEPWWESYEDD